MRNYDGAFLLRHLDTDFEMNELLFQSWNYPRLFALSGMQEWASFMDAFKKLLLRLELTRKVEVASTYPFSLIYTRSDKDFQLRSFMISCKSY